MQEEATPTFEDTTGAILWASDIEKFQRNKCSDSRAHYVRDLFQRGEIEISHIASDTQYADIMTKPLHATYFI